MLSKRPWRPSPHWTTRSEFVLSFPLGFAHCFHFSVARNDILKPFTLVLVIPFCTNWQLKSYCWFKVVYWLRGRHDGTGGYHVGVPRPLVVVTLLSGICQGQLLMWHMFGGLHWIPTIKTVQCPLPPSNVLSRHIFPHVWVSNIILLICNHIIFSLITSQKIRDRCKFLSFIFIAKIVCPL